MHAPNFVTSSRDFNIKFGSNWDPCKIHRDLIFKEVGSAEVVLSKWDNWNIWSRGSDK